MAWKVLGIDSPAIPRILVKCSFDNSGYQIELTDLSRVWAHRLSKNDIIERASDLGSSIDPSEDDEQYKILLGKIESALNCEDGTSLNISSGKGEDDSLLRIDLRAPLPKPLPPFRWTLELHRQSQEYIEAEIVTPLILQSSNLVRQVQQLINGLHDKDRIISKICDRLETSGNDLTTVFPGVSNIKTSRKKSQREQLAKHVKGLEDFDEATFKQDAHSASTDAEMASHVMNEVFRNLPVGRSTHQGSSDWWQRLGKGRELIPDKDDVKSSDRDHHDNHVERSRSVGNFERQAESFQDEDFQRQGTPPHLKTGDSQHHSMSPHAVKTSSQVQSQANDHLDDESTTDEEDDLDAPSGKVGTQNPQATPKRNQISDSPRKLGAIGGRSSQTRDGRVSDAGVDVPKQHSKLGAIGGKSKAPEAGLETTERTSSTQKSPSPKKTIMGMIGGKKATRSSSPPVATESFAPSAPAKEVTPTRSTPPAKVTTPAPQENPEERADKKRDQLKRELDEKAKAPVKKKRKF